MNFAAFMRACLSSLLFCSTLTSPPAIAQETAATPARVAIPYKTEPSPIESHGEGVGIAMLLLLAGAAGVLYFVRRRLPQMQLKRGTAADVKRIRIIEQMRLNPRTNLYLIRINQREILIGQSGDTLTTLDTTAAQTKDVSGAGQSGGADSV